MVALISDACFVVHAAGLRAGGLPFLEFLDQLAARPDYHLTNTVRTEAVRHGGSDWVSSLEEQDRLHPAKNEHKKARAEMQRLKKRYKGKVPGTHDVGLLRLAKETGHVLLTDDHALYDVAGLEGLATLDVFDVLQAGVGAGRLGVQCVQDALMYLAGESPHYHPSGWRKLQKNQRLSWPDGYDALARERREPDELAVLLGATVVTFAADTTGASADEAVPDQEVVVEPLAGSASRPTDQKLRGPRSE